MKKDNIFKWVLALILVPIFYLQRNEQMTMKNWLELIIAEGLLQIIIHDYNKSRERNNN